MVLSLERWVGKTAIVTGASSGIGYKIVQNLVEAGINVVGVARRVELIKTLAQQLSGEKGKLHPFQADVTKPEEIYSVFKYISEKNLGPIHILINCAGVFHQNSNLLTVTDEEIHSTLDLNVVALTITTREAVNDMIKNKIDGHIIHINSVLGHVVPNFPTLNVYGASKFAVSALTETLRNDLKTAKTKIKISSISPGVVRTEMSVYNKNLTEEKREYLLNHVPGLEPQDIVDGVLYVLSTPPHVQVHELTIKPVGEAA